MWTFTLTGDLQLLNGWVEHDGPHARIATGGPEVWQRAMQGPLDCGFDLTLTVRHGWLSRPLPGWRFGLRTWALLTVEYAGQRLDLRFDLYRSGWRCTAIELDVILLCGRASRLRQALLPSTWEAAVRHLVAVHVNDDQVFGEPVVLTGAA